MSDLHVVIEPERIVTATLVLRSWTAEDASDALEIYGDRETSAAVGRRTPVADVAEMRELLTQWDLQSSRRSVPQGLWAVEAVEDGGVLGGATLLPFSSSVPELVMGWHLRPHARGRGIAGEIGHALAHHAFVSGDADAVYLAASAENSAALAVGRRLGMRAVDDIGWTHAGARLTVLRMVRDDLHKIRPGISLDSSYDPEGLVDW
jgi:RimJ/RimL family protein N-acetyltransferase